MTSDRPQLGHGSQPTHLTFFRAGEVFLLFERAGSLVSDDGIDSDALRQVCFEVAGVRLSERFDPFLDRSGRSRRAITTFERRNGSGDASRYMVVTVNLEHWMPNIEHFGRDDTHNPIFERSLQSVPVAVADLNGNSARIVVGNWRLLQASPNWVAVPFCWWDGGGPGGRPVRPMELRRFRPFGRPENVREEVFRLIGEPLSPEVRGKLRVAILDSWPMDTEPEVMCGSTPVKPLEKVRRFIENNPEARFNDFLQAAARGDIVHPDRFFDYVSCQPSGPIPATQHNWATSSFEPAYDTSDHGLFIAGVIKDIAPDAEISLYRVLADDGSGDLGTIVQAVQDAIQHAGGERLLINMSLGFAPPLIMTRLLLDFIAGSNSADGNGVLDADSWSRSLKSNSKSDLAYASEANSTIDATKLKSLNLAQLDNTNHIERLDDLFMPVDVFFRLPREARVFVVAAAGNDSAGSSVRFGPRLPAAVNGVLGVSAAGADFSNRDDVENRRDDGVSAFGGLAAISGATRTMQTTDGLVGMAIAPNLWSNPSLVPTDPAMIANDHGWALWAGTSFAAPVATGLAACIWAERGPNYPISDLMVALCGVPGPGHNEIQLRQQPC